MIGFFLRLLLPLATAPGVAVHEAAHALACRLTGTRVLEVRYFSLGIPPGWVHHETPASVWAHALIAGFPFLLNSALGFGLGWTACAAGLTLPSRLLLLWIAISIATHAFPSLGDATSLLETLWGRRSGWIARLLLTPLGAVMVAGAFGALYLLLDLAYGLTLGWLLPRLLCRDGLT